MALVYVFPFERKMVSVCSVCSVCGFPFERNCLCAVPCVPSVCVCCMRVLCLACVLYVGDFKPLTVHHVIAHRYGIGYGRNMVASCSFDGLGLLVKDAVLLIVADTCRGSESLSRATLRSGTL